MIVLLRWVLLVCCLFITWPSVASNLVTPVSAVITTQAPLDLATQRADYLLAQAALREGNYKLFQALTAKLQNYPLYPYLLYADLSQHLATAKSTDVQAFITQYADTPLASRLWVQWMELLAKKQFWPDFLVNYKPTTNLNVQCLEREGLIQSGQQQNAFNGIADVWLSLDKQPASCQMVLDQWQQTNGLTLLLLWQKLYLALSNSNLDVIRSLLPLVPINERWVIQLWAAIYSNPDLLAEPHLLDNTEPVTPYILKVALQKLADKDVQNALYIWQTLQSSNQFTPAEQQQSAKILGIALAADGDPRALYWLNQAGNDPSEEGADIWRVRVQLTQQNWPEVLKAISQLTPDQQHLPVWRYWQARALAAVGQYKSAMDIYGELATQEGYYAQLAAMQAKLPKIKNLHSLPINTDRLQAIANMPAMQRAYELYQLNDKGNARSEWHWALNKLPADQYLDAAQLATQWGWFDCAILTNQLLGDEGDVTLRYPLAYRAMILTAAKQFNLNPAWLFAEIRQESLFQVQARSSAGALGLMQLLPGTALLLADKMHWQFTGDATLFDAGSNIEIGGDYLQKLTKLFHGDIVSATAAYNAGPARVDKWLAKQGNLPADIRVDTLPWYETRDYVKNIMASTTLYEELLGEPNTFNQRMGMVEVKKVAIN